MIPYSIFIAAICTLIIILFKFVDIKNNRFYNILLNVLYVTCIFFWVNSIFPNECLITSIVTLLIFFLLYFKNLNVFRSKNNVVQEIQPTVVDNNQTFNFLIGRTGIIKNKCEDGYIGVFDDTQDTVLVYSIDKFENGDKFITDSIENNKIIAKKIYI